MSPRLVSPAAGGTAGASDYAAFLACKAQLESNDGFDADDLPAALFDFQRALVAWGAAAPTRDATDDASESAA